MFELLDSMIWIVTQIFHVWLMIVFLGLLFSGATLTAAKILKDSVRNRASGVVVKET